MTSFLPVVPAILGVALFACGTPDETEDALASGDAVVTGGTFGRASAIVRGIDYLPFEYQADGCYARALYMGMELAAEGIESNAIFVFAKDEAHELPNLVVALQKANSRARAVLRRCVRCGPDAVRGTLDIQDANRQPIARIYLSELMRQIS